MISAQDHILIERFIEGTLTGAELKEFQERMTGDDSFKKEVEFYYLLFSGIRLSREHELTNYITSNVSVKHYTPRSVIAIVIVMLIIIASGIGVWNYLERDETTGKKKFFMFQFFNKEKNKLANTTGSDKQKGGKKNSNKENAMNSKGSSENARSNAKNDSITAAFSQVHPDDSLSEDAKIVIRKDELISSAEIPIVNKSQEQKPDTDRSKGSLTKEAVDKLNPGAQLPEVEDTPATLQVEFWQSPVNYKGFKLAKNKLVLFGIDRPDAVRLYSLNDQLYMQYGQIFSKLSPTYDYQSFLALKESEIPPQLK